MSGFWLFSFELKYIIIYFAFQLTNLLKETIPCLKMERNFEEDTKRGDKIRINITNLLEPVTRQEYIAGIRFKYIPYIPMQNGKDVFFQKKTFDLICDTESENCVEKYNNKHILNVVPEYSYKISASYLTKVP